MSKDREKNSSLLVRHPVLAALSVLALLVGMLPVFLAQTGAVADFGWNLILLNLVAWLFVSYLFYSKRKLLIDLEIAINAIGLPLAPGDLQEKVTEFLKESKRYHRAAYAFRVEQNITSHDLVKNLRRIVELAYTEFNAVAVQLTLADEATGLSTQSMLIGNPIIVSSQEMPETSAADSEWSSGDASQIIKQVLSFAGNNFGTLFVQLQPGYFATKSDLQVLYLLATQASMMLVDARFTDELLRMRRTSEESVRAKTGFLANLSHEIRGPLGIILNAVELILDNLCGPITEVQRETLSMIRSNGTHLIDLVNDVLDYAKVEAGKVAVKPAEIGLKEFLDDLATVVQSQALAKKHKLLVEPVDGELGMVCDKRHARQMLINFLTNAIKYTQDGGTITLRAERLTDNRVKISVKDTGIGIPQSQRVKVFSAFERVDDKYALAQVGAGLGMPLTLRLAEVNGGSADFESEEGKGSTFWIVMPAVTVKSAGNEKKESGESGKIAPQGHGEQILLVDHDAQTREMLGRYLGHQGFQILDAKSGADVVQLLRTKEVQLAVVENDMPDLSGEEMVAAIRANPKFATLPIILLSSRAFVFDIERFLKLGVDRCLSKPVDLSDLAVTARKLLDEVKAPQVGSAEGSTTNPPGSSTL